MAYSRPGATAIRRFVSGTCLAVMLAAAGCGGGGRGSDPAPPDSSGNPPVASGGVASDVTTINGITVPPDPGAAGKASLAGVDVNANGVRDEVERELAAFYGKTPVMHAAALDFARKLQVPLTKPGTTSADAITSLTSELIAFECFATALGDRDNALAAAQVVATRTYNTKNRLAEHTRVCDLSGLTELPEVGVPACN